jgi:hypothetical protein
MKGIIAYYSSTGNTKLACQYIASKLGVPFDLVDVAKEKQVDLEPLPKRSTMRQGMGWILSQSPLSARRLVDLEQAAGISAPH